MGGVRILTGCGVGEQGESRGANALGTRACSAGLPCLPGSARGTTHVKS